MCVITATELKQNLGKYIEMSKDEDIIVKKNGKIVTMLTTPEMRPSKLEDLLSFAGACEYVDYEKLLDERDIDR